MSRRPRWLPALALAATALAAVTTLGRGGPAAAQAVRLADLHYPALPAFELPRPQRTVLANGLVVLTLENHTLPLVEISVLVHAGGGTEPPDQTGLAQLASSTLCTGGTERLSPDELDELLDDRSALFECSTTLDASSVRLRALAEDFPELLGVFADVLRRPAFAEDRLAVEKVKQRDLVARQNDDPAGIVKRELRKAVYGAGSPLARRPTFASLDRIARGDVVAWHRAWFHPDRMVIGLSGDFRTADALRLLERSFGDWPRGGGAPLPPEPPETKPAAGIYFAEKDDINQANIAFGAPGIREDDPGYFAVEVLNQLFSGNFGARLPTNVRTKKGLAYSISGGVGSDPLRRGLTYLFLSTKTATTAAGIDAMLAEMRDVAAASPPTAEEVEKAKQAILSSFIFDFESSRFLLRRQLTLEYYGRPLDWLSRYRAGIEAVTAEQVRKAAAEHLRPENLTIVVVAPKEGMDRPLSTFGKVTNLDISIPGARAATAPGTAH